MMHKDGVAAQPVVLNQDQIMLLMAQKLNEFMQAFNSDHTVAAKAPLLVRNIEDLFLLYPGAPSAEIEQTTSLGESFEEHYKKYLAASSRLRRSYDHLKETQSTKNLTEVKKSIVVLIATTRIILDQGYAMRRLDEEIRKQKESRIDAQRSFHIALRLFFELVSGQDADSFASVTDKLDPLRKILKQQNFAEHVFIADMQSKFEEQQPRWRFSSEAAAAITQLLGVLESLQSASDYAEIEKCIAANAALLTDIFGSALPSYASAVGMSNGRLFYMYKGEVKYVTEDRSVASATFRDFRKTDSAPSCVIC